MPRPETQVKTKTSPGLIDLHFHGAFGVDLMTAPVSDLNELSAQLSQRGISGFCPTTLSTPWDDFLPTVRKLGQWTRSHQAPGAKPLGLHLEGPYLSADASGAHPSKGLRKFSLSELETLWIESQKTLKILTIAPELLSADELKALVRWAKPKKIHLSAGHSRATEDQATRAFKAGFRGVTHAWNAMGFHQREPGILGASLGNEAIFLELIIDLAHVSPTVLRWTRSLHENCCLVSDCISAAGTNGSSTYPFGPLKVRVSEGAARTQDGLLAGGASLLPESIVRFVRAETNRDLKAPNDSATALQLFSSLIPQATSIPLQALQLPLTQVRALQKPRIKWHFRAGSQKRGIEFEVLHS